MLEPSRTTTVGQLAPYLKGLRRRAKLIALITLVAGGVALALSLSATKKYKATSKVFISQTNPVQNIVGQNQQQPQDPERDLNSKVSLIKLESVAERVKNQLHLATPTDDLLKQVETEIEGTTELVDINVTDPDPKAAADIANSFATEFATARQASARGTIQEAVDLAQQQLDNLTEGERTGAQGRELADQLRQLQIAAALQTGGIEIAAKATVPTAASSPKTKLNTAAALFLGLIFGLVVALAAEALDRRVREEEDLEGYDRPVLAKIPRPRSDDPHEEDFALREAFSTLATNLRFFQLGRDVAAVVVTSPAPREGKTTTTLGLARALADLGLRVLAIECDLRRPMFSTYMDMPSRGGLSTVLAGVTEFDRELVDVDAATLRPLDADGESRSYFTVLPAGPVPPNPQGLLSSAAMRDVVRRARASAEIVLLDTAPVGTVNDVVTLSELVDGIVLVAKLKQTRRDEVQRALRTLSNLPSPVLGFAVTDAPRGSESYYGYDRPVRSWTPEKTG
ncbi:MAG: polysaccharide biosynthesis tyrosine autokinase [Solirubrobacteraceae bacterium]